MHGADRIGGLSTANGLVFGGIAGRSAAAHCQAAPEPPECCELEGMAAEGCEDRLRRLRDSMSRHAMVRRSGEGLQAALHLVEELREGGRPAPSGDHRAIAGTLRLAGQLRTAECILRGALLRRESRGSHYRDDHPEPDRTQTEQILVGLEDGQIRARFAGEWRD